jgi:hypothetical protein
MEQEDHYEEAEVAAEMEMETETAVPPIVKPKIDSNKAIIIGSAMISLAMIIGTSIYGYAVTSSSRGVVAGQTASAQAQSQSANTGQSALQEEVIPAGGVVLPVTWGDLGKQMVQAGVIDEAQFTALYAQNGGLPQDMKALLDSSNNGQITMTSQNSGIILNLLWALGLGNKNPILENGPMQDPQYGGAGKFASTGGWTLAKGDAMTHYDMHQFMTLTSDEQSLVETVAKNIYRPCCGNATYFPDCNHGMAMLGLLELMASQGASADQMYKTALAVNSYWFPSNYLTIAQYLQSRGIDWKTVNPKDLLAANFSSAQGYAAIVAQTQPVQGKSSGGCGV